MTKLGFKYEPNGSLMAIEIIGNRVTSLSTMYMGVTRYSTIEGLKFSKSGMIAEFPDLKNLPFEEMRKEAIKRFKEKLKTMKTEQEVTNYLIDDLKKYGYKLYKIDKKGFRTKKV